MDTRLEDAWKGFFESGFYEEGWVQKTNPQVTQEEVAGVLRLLNPAPGSRVLDWCGGSGRHALELAKLGYKVTLLDFAKNHIVMAEERAKEAGVEIATILADFRQTPEDIQADYAVNMFTAGIGYLTEEDDIAALVSLHKSLRPGARFLLDTMNLFWLARNYNPRGWDRVDDRLTVIEERKFDFLTNQNHAVTTFLRDGVVAESQTLDHRIYSPAELTRVLKKAGFNPVELYGGFDGRPLDFSTRRMIIISEK